QPPRSLAHAPVFQVAFAWQNAPEGVLDLSGLTVTHLDTPHVTAIFDISLSLHEAGQQIVGCLEYSTALFEGETVRRYLGYWRTLLKAMVADELQAVDRLPLLGEMERRQLLVEWNSTRVEYPQDYCIYELIEAQAATHPDAVAAVHQETLLTYGELNAR